MERLAEFVVNHWDLFLALLIILLMMVWGPLMRRIRDYKEIEAVDAVALMNHRDALLIDVREEGEVKEGYILNSLHIPLRDLGKRLDELESYRARPLIVGCRSGSRSAMACGTLRKQQFAEVYNLRGGVMAWQSAGLPLSKPDKRRKKRKT
ncbi:rhodanese-like domain-containing protein [Ectothiorhodospiraceae bacterium BW-2]|nr:rhodanese-like domain-containing protein [Ectothiorhodospiraceae bacterium BW-2]